MATHGETSSAVNLRLPQHFLDLAEALMQAAQSAPELAILPTVTRSDVLRLCLLKGLEALEAQYEDVVDQELADEADRRLRDPGERGGVPLEEMLKGHGV